MKKKKNLGIIGACARRDPAVVILNAASQHSEETYVSANKGGDGD